MILVERPFAQLDSQQFVTFVGRAEFQCEVVEQFAFVDRQNHLSFMLFRKHPYQSRELGDVHFVHSLNGVIEHETWERWIHGEVESKEK